VIRTCCAGSKEPAQFMRHRCFWPGFDLRRIGTHRRYFQEMRS
jgi:hypothetical protein